MGIAYAAGMVLICLLVVAQFRSYLVPLVIMAPIPLTVIRVMRGHALLGAQFAATSMIALAGIIVRNSILLVDLINHETARGLPLAQAVVERPVPSPSACKVPGARAWPKPGRSAPSTCATARLR